MKTINVTQLQVGDYISFKNADFPFKVVKVTDGVEVEELRGYWMVHAGKLKCEKVNKLTTKAELNFAKSLEGMQRIYPAYPVSRR